MDKPSPITRSLVVVRWGQRVLLGFNAGREQWELPGGALESGESPHEAAIRELAEETGIRVDRLALVARAEFMFESQATVHLAAVFSLGLDGAPHLVENDELTGFMWWDPRGDLCEGLCLLDAEVARRC
ncbi:MAG TPA: NUDIX hydrolase [Acidimicrobiales bacterium]|nr:NUDIX hydrolase [Acidimicrobiales bacterium]